MNPAACDFSETDIEAWILAQLEQRIGIPAARIERDLPLDGYGVDSVEAVLISGELADWLRMDLDPAIVIDNPTVSGLTRAVAAAVAGRR